MSASQRPVTKRRIQITIDIDLHDELQKTVAVIPGTSVSGLINDGIKATMPFLAEIRKAMEEENEERAMSALANMVGSAVLGIHTPKGTRDETENSS